LVVGDERLAAIDTKRQIEDSVVGERETALSRQIALEDVESVMARGGLAGNQAQKQTAPLLDCLAQDFLPILADGNLLLVEPDQAAGLLELAHDIAGDLQIRRGVADKNAAASSVLFTVAFCREIGIASGDRMFVLPTGIQLRNEVNWVDGKYVDLFGETA